MALKCQFYELGENHRLTLRRFVGIYTASEQRYLPLLITTMARWLKDE
jgi:hypothetical protein